MKTDKGMKIVTAVAFLAATSSFAGDVLKLKAGTIRLRNASEQLLFQTLNTSEPEQSGAEKYFVIQFSHKIPTQAREQLASLGLKVLRYLPDDAYVVRGDARSAGLAKDGIEGVSAVTSFLPEWKVSPEFRHGLRAESSKSERILVSAFDSGASYRIERELSLIAGARITRTGSRDIVIETSPAYLGQIASQEGVEWIEKMPIYTTMDFVVEVADTTPSTGIPAGYQFTGFESGTRLMNFEAAASRGYTGTGQVVAVADTGLDSGDAASVHPDFVGNLLKGYSVGLGGSTWGDSMGHGTHVCGSVVGNGKSSNGQLKGGAYNAKLVILSIWSDILDNLAPGNDFEKIVGTAYPDGARIHSNSWGSNVNPGAYDTMASRVDEYMWKHPDMLVLFAAGNAGQDTDGDGRIDENSIGSPATAKNVLTVGASENELAVGGIQKKLKDLRDGDKKWGAEPLASDTLSNNRNGMAAFSSRGPTTDGRIKPEIVAPGTNIISTRSHNPKANKLWGEFGPDYAYAGGTSMATPLTAGAAAVTREYLIKARNIRNPSAALVKATLMHTAVDLYPGQYGEGPKQELPTRRPNIHEGYGRVDMDQVTRLGGETMIVDDTTGLGNGDEKSTSLKLRGGASLRVTLTYTDAPSSASAEKALVNDLDVKVITPSGEVKQLEDRVNNTEMLELDQLSAGDYKVVVSGVNVPSGKNGKQPYALLITQF